VTQYLAPFAQASSSGSSSPAGVLGGMLIPMLLIFGVAYLVMHLLKKARGRRAMLSQLPNGELPQKSHGGMPKRLLIALMVSAIGGYVIIRMRSEPVFNLAGLRLGMSCKDAAASLFQLEQNYKAAKAAAIAANPVAVALDWDAVKESQYALEQRCLEGGTGAWEMDSLAHHDIETIPVALPDGTGFNLAYAATREAGITYLALYPVIWDQPNIFRQWTFVRNRVTPIDASTREEWTRLKEERERRANETFQQSLEPFLAPLGHPLATVTASSVGPKSEIRIWKQGDRLLGSGGGFPMLLVAQPHYVFRWWRLDELPEVDGLIAKLRKAGVKL
jgi:hypothetical protein